MSQITPSHLLLAATLGVVALFSGCASVTRGTKDTLVVESEPSGANVRLSTGQTGKTPTSFQLPRKNALDLYIDKDGYEPLTVHISSQVSGTGAAGMAGNVLVGGIIGVGVDVITGATKDLKPNPVKVILVPVGAKAAKVEDPAPVVSPPPEPAPPTVKPIEAVADSAAPVGTTPAAN